MQKECSKFKMLYWRAQDTRCQDRHDTRVIYFWKASELLLKEDKKKQETRTSEKTGDRKREDNATEDSRCDFADITESSDVLVMQVSTLSQGKA